MEYPWYELIENSDEITQGDIIKNCPVAIIEDCDIEIDKVIEAKISQVDGIILTQACDLANGKVKSVIICSVTSKNEFEECLRKEQKTEKQIKKAIEGIIKGQQHAYHIVNKYDSVGHSEDYYIVNFKDIHSIPVDLIKKVAKKDSKRLRLLPPYREHLSQAFARYFMRVGLPININMND